MLYNYVIVFYDEYEFKMILNKSEFNDLFFIILLLGEIYELLEVINLF